MEITTGNNSFWFQGKQYNRGALTVTYGVDTVSLGNTTVKISDLKLDGQGFETLDQVREAFDGKVFKKGGGSTGEGVQTIYWDDVQEKPLKTIQTPIENAEGMIPVYNQNGQLPVGIPEFPENAVPLILLDARIQSLTHSDVGADQLGSAINAQSNANTYTDNAISGLRVGLSNGIATLDSSGKVPLSMLNVSGLTFKGAWNPITNTPNLVDGTGNVGDFYKASESGSFNFGNGEYNFNAGDWAIFAAGVWQRLGSNELVSSVNGYIGQVELDHNDVGALPSTYVPNWGNIQNKPSSAVSNIDDAVTKRHEHSNKSVLDLLTASGGVISYNGIPIATQQYVNQNGGGVISSVVNSWKIREYLDRIEYSRRVNFSFSVGTGGARYQTHNTNINSPSGINLANADEHYISLNNSNRTADLCVFQDGGTGTFRVGAFNNYNDASSITVNGDFYVKLIRYK